MKFFMAVLQLSIILYYDTLKILKSGLDIGPIIVTKENKAEYINYLNTEDVMGFTWFVVELNEAEQIRLEMFS